jgi:excinuclease UvrABC nuclease subunit
MNKDLADVIKNLPKTPGAYIFTDSTESVLYVGKAKNIKKRVANHFQKPDQHIYDFMPQVSRIDFIGAANENEALLIESQLIKKIQPKYNVAWKDDKDYFFIAVTDEALPRVTVTHQPKQNPHSLLAGPFMRGGELKLLLPKLRGLFPFRTCAKLAKKPCMYQDLGLCCAPCIHRRSKKRYQAMLKTMMALLGLHQNGRSRIEGYDISNLSGTLAVGSMVVFENGKPNKNEYRKFKIKQIVGQNDVGSLREVITRRLKHDEWRQPDIMLIDGGKGQLKAVKGLDVPAIALAKFKRSGGKIFTPYSKSSLKLDYLPENVKNLLLQVRDEAHRFAITYHKQRRQKIIAKF